MTSNQSSMLVKNPNTKKAVAVLKKYAELEIQLKEAEKEAKVATETIKEAMIAQDVEKVTFDPEISGIEGYITLAERVGYKLEEGVSIDEIDEKYSKRALDTTKVKAQATLTGQLPSGVEETRTQYITKKIKVVE